MALIPKITLSALLADASGFSLQETTGDYSTTNPGGYGDLNIDRSLAAGVLIQVYHEGDELEIATYKPFPATDFIAGTFPQLISISQFGESGYFGDGVLHVQYHVLLAPIILSSVAADGLTVNSNEEFRSNESVVVVGTTSYRVDTAAPNTPSSLKLLDPIPVTTTSVETGYTGTSHMFNNRHVESDLASAIGAYAGQCGCNDKKTMDLMEILLKNLGAQVRYNCGDLRGAQNILVALRNTLKGGSCGC